MPKRITVKIKPRSRHTSLEEIEPGVFLAKVNAPPIDGRANQELINLLAEYFDCPKSAVEIVSGETSKNKVIVINK